MATSKFNTKPKSKFDAAAESKAAADTVRRARIHKAVCTPEPEIVDVIERNEAASTEIPVVTTKDVVQLIAASIFGFVTMSACIALLSAFLWYWLAIVIAFIATLIAGNKFNKWFDTSGYDACVSAVRKIGDVFTRRSVLAA